MTNNLEINVWIGNLGKYNEGELVGEWFTLPVDFKEVSKVIGLNEQYEEWYVGDYEAPFEIHEYSNISHLNEVAEMIAEYTQDDVKAAAVLFENGYAETMLEAFEKLDDTMKYYDCHDMTDVAHEWIASCGGVEYAVSNPQFYFDLEGFTRDLEIDGYFNEIEEETGEEMTDGEKEAHADELAESCGGDIYERYFDYEAFGRDMDIEGYFYYVGEGVYIQVFN